MTIARHESTILAAISKASGSVAVASGGKDLSGAALVDCAARALLCTISSHASRQRGSTLFDSHCVPAISLSDYLQILHRNLGCSDAVLVCATALLDRVLVDSATEPSEAIRLTVWNVHRLFFACLVLAAKYNEDHVLRNSDYARCGGISTASLNEYERFLLRKLSFRLNVGEEQYVAYLGSLATMEDTIAASDGLLTRMTSAAWCAKVAGLHAWNTSTYCIPACLSGVALISVTMLFSRRARQHVAKAPVGHA